MASIQLRAECDLDALAAVRCEDASGNYARGCTWAPDGSCLLVASNDNRLRLFNLPPSLTGLGSEECERDHRNSTTEGGARALSPHASTTAGSTREKATGSVSHQGSSSAAATPVSVSLTPAVTVHEGGLIYDYAWAPFMRSDDAATCVFASSSRDHPVHLWDAYSGRLRATYQNYDQYDAMTAAHSLAFSSDGLRLLCGLRRLLHVHDVSRPGRNYTVRPTKPRRGGGSGISGVVSRIAVTDPGAETPLVACGAFSGHVAVFSDSASGGQHVLDLPQLPAGVTDLRFAPDGHYLWCGVRARPEVFCFDLRHAQRPALVLHRGPLSNQRMYFDLTPDGRWLTTGTRDGRLLLFDTWDAVESSAASAAALARAGITVTATTAVTATEATGMTEMTAVTAARVTVTETVSAAAATDTMDDSGSLLAPVYSLAHPPHTLAAHPTATNGVAAHPFLPLLATVSGQRRFGVSLAGGADDADGNSSDEGEAASRTGDKGGHGRDDALLGPDNAVRLWSLNSGAVGTAAAQSQM